MPVHPDGFEVVATEAEARKMVSPPLLILDSVERYFDERGLGSGPISWSRVGDGQSNVTYRIDRGADSYVLRRGPRPPYPVSAHDMTREARFQMAIRSAGARVPRILSICTDTSVLGVPFYVMEYLEGIVFTDSSPTCFDGAEERRAISMAAVDELTHLHEIDVHGPELAEFLRPSGYLARQIQRFSSLWTPNSRRQLDDVSRVRDWLADNVPTGPSDVTIVHGDFRIGNLMYGDRPPTRIEAVLDWELATIGDPLADLGYFTATYAEQGSAWTPMELTPLTRATGFLTRAEIADRYRARTGRSIDALPWYQVLALWKAAIFCEGIYTRWLDGERPDDTTFGPSLALGIPEMLSVARETVGLTPNGRSALRRGVHWG